MQKNRQPIRINIVAYNEALFIEKCLDSIELSLEYASQQDAIVSIIANGCRDNTFGIASAYCKERPGWTAYDVKLGDKANAWNYGINLDDGSNPFTVYVDGDCTISEPAISALLDTYSKKPDSYIIAGIPGTKGNTTEETIRRTLDGKALSGNFYALTPEFLAKAADKNFLLPVGLIGDDSLLAWVSSHDFKLSNGVIPGLLVGSEGADFFYHRLTPDSLDNIRLYIRRIYRYSLRHLQQCCIREHLDVHDNFETLPAHIDDIYDKRKLKHIRKNSIYGLFDLASYLSLKMN